jgi:hypothetical protein
VSFFSEINREEIMKALDSLLEKIWKQGISSVIGWLSDSIPEKSKLTDYSYLMKETLFGKKLYQFLFTNLIPFKEELGKIFQQIEKQKQTILAEKKEKAKEKTAQEERRRKQQQVAEEEKEEEEDEDDDYQDNNTVRMEEEEEDGEEQEEEEEEEEGENEDDKATKHAFSKMKSSKKLSVEDQRKKAQEFAERVLGLSFGKKTGKAKKAAATKKGMRII